MTYQQAVAYFGSQEKLARALGIRQPSVSVWRRKGPNVVPAAWQYRLEIITAGALRVDEQLRRPSA